jgi:ABC-2 type transport system permease protein
MSARVTLATARRVLRQLRRDPRTIAMLLGVPVVLLTLLRGISTAARRPSTPPAGRCSRCSRSP